MQVPYLYQIVHTRGYTPYSLPDHCNLLERAYMQLWARSISLNRGDIARDVESLLREERVSKMLSTHVELRLWADGRLTMKVVQKSVYEGYTLRCWSPYAICQRYDYPFGEHPSSLRRAMDEWAHHTSIEQGGDVAIRVGMDGVARSCYSSPLFGVKGRTIYSSPCEWSVERDRGVYAVRHGGYMFEERAIKEEELTLFDELFWVDAYGITAISQLGDRRYMSIVSEKIAQEIE